MNIQEFKKKNPAYKNVDDDKLAAALHEKYYKDKMSLSKFRQRTGLTPEIIAQGKEPSFWQQTKNWASEEWNKLTGKPEPKVGPITQKDIQAPKSRDARHIQKRASLKYSLDKMRRKQDSSPAIPTIRQLAKEHREELTKQNQSLPEQQGQTLTFYVKAQPAQRDVRATEMRTQGFGVSVPSHPQYPEQETYIKAIKEGIKDVARSGLQLGEGMADYLATLSEEAMQKLPEDLQKKLKQKRNEQPEGITLTQDELQSFSDAMHKTVQKIPSEQLKTTGLYGYTLDVTRIAPQIATQVIATLAGGAPAGIAAIGAQIAGSTYGQLKKEANQKGKEFDPVKAFQASLANAAVQSALEQIGIGKMLKGWTPGTGAKQAIRSLVDKFGTEFLTEFTQQYPDAVSRIAAKSNDMDDFVQRMNEQNWSKITEQGAYQGLTTAPFAGFGMAFTRQGPQPVSISPDVALQGKASSFEGGNLEGPTIVKGQAQEKTAPTAKAPQQPQEPTQNEQIALQEIPGLDINAAEDMGQLMFDVNDGLVEPQKLWDTLKQLRKGGQAGFDSFNEWKSAYQAETHKAEQLGVDTKDIDQKYKALANPDWIEKKQREGKSREPSNKTEQTKAQLDREDWLREKSQKGQNLVSIIIEEEQSGEVTPDEANQIKNAVTDFEEAAGRSIGPNDTNEIKTFLDTEQALDEAAQRDSELGQFGIDQAKETYKLQTDYYRKGIKRIKKMGGLNIDHLNSEFGLETSKELKRRFGQGIAKKNGEPLDVAAQNLAIEAPELGIEPGGDIESLRHFLDDRAKSWSEIHDEYYGRLNSIKQEGDQFNVKETEQTKYKIQRAKQPKTMAFRTGQRPVQKSLLDLYRPEEKRGQIKTDDKLLDNILNIYGDKIKQARIGSFKTSKQQIKTPQDAAQLVNPITKEAQETVVAIAADKNNKPLAILRHSIGTASTSQVDPAHLLGALYEIPDTSQFWIVHNHPGRETQPSKADEEITRIIYDNNRYAGAPRFNGMLSITQGGEAQLLTPYREGGEDTQTQLKQSDTFQFEPNLSDSIQTVPYVRREITEYKQKYFDTKLNDDKKVNNFLDDQDLKNGVILMNIHMRPVGHLKLSRDEMLSLGQKEKSDTAQKLYKALARTNAKVILPHTTQSSDLLPDNTSLILKPFYSFADQNALTMPDFIAKKQSAFRLGRMVQEKGGEYVINDELIKQFEAPKGDYSNTNNPPRIPGDPENLMSEFNSEPIKKWMNGGEFTAQGADLLDNMQKEAKNKGQKLSLKSNDINFIDANTVLPYWLAKDDMDFARLYGVETKRQQTRNIFREGLLDEARPFLEARRKLNKKQRNKLKELIRTLDKKRISPLTPEFDQIIDQIKPDNQTVEAYMSARHVLDYIWNEHLPTLMEKQGFTKNEIQEYRQQVGDVAGYWPRRRKGRYYIKVSKGDRTLYREHFNDIIALLTRGRISPKLALKQKQLGQKFPGTRLEAGNVKRLVEEIYFQTSPEATEQLINAVIKSPEIQKTGEAGTLEKTLKKTAADIFKQRGFMGHGMERKDIEGYETDDPWEDFVNYISGYAGYVTKMEAAPEFSKALGKMNAEEKPNLYQYSTKYVRDVMQVSDNFDKSVDKARGLAFHWYLGGILKSSALQLTQNWIAGIPVLQRYTAFPETKIAKHMLRSMQGNIQDIVNKVTGGKKEAAWKRLPEDQVAGLNRARKSGIISDQYTQELLGNTLSSFGKKAREIENASKFLFGQAEIFNRESMWITGYEIARRKGMSKEKAWDFADQVTLEAHFPYGKGDLPPFARGGKVAKAARAGYTFRSFTHNILSLYRRLYREHAGMSMTKALLYLLAFGGLSGIPLYDNIEEWIQKHTGKNIRSEIAKRTNDSVDTLINYGLPGLFGIDLTGSISIEIPTKIKQIPGVMYDFLYGSPQKALGQLEHGDYWRTMEKIGPSVFRYPMESYRLWKWGETTPSGKPIREKGEKVHLTLQEAIGQAAGFRPTKLSEGYRKWEARIQGLEYWHKKKQKLVDEFHKIGQRYGYQNKQIQEVLAKIKQFNKQLPSYIAPITRQTLKSRLRGPSKREQAAKKEFQ